MKFWKDNKYYCVPILVKIIYDDSCQRKVRNVKIKLNIHIDLLPTLRAL